MPAVVDVGPPPPPPEALDSEVSGILLQVAGGDGAAVDPAAQAIAAKGTTTLHAVSPHGQVGRRRTVRHPSAYLSRVSLGSWVLASDFAQVIPYILTACSSGNPASQFHALQLLVAISEGMGQMSEPYLVPALPVALNLAAARDEAVRQKAEETATVLGARLSGALAYILPVRPRPGPRRTNRRDLALPRLTFVPPGPERDPPRAAIHTLGAAASPPAGL